MLRRLQSIPSIGNPGGLLRSWGSTILLVGLVAASAQPSSASPDSRWQLRATVGLVVADDTVAIETTLGEPLEAAASLDIGDGTELALALEWTATKRIGIELGYVSTQNDTRFALGGETTIRDDDTVALETFRLGINWHFRSLRSRFEVVLGAFVAMSKPEDLIFNTEIGRHDKLTFDDDIGPGARAALQFPLGTGRWVAVAEARYTLLLLESDSGARDVEYDPLALGLGVAYRFGS